MSILSNEGIENIFIKKDVRFRSIIITLRSYEDQQRYCFPYHEEMSKDLKEHVCSVIDHAFHRFYGVQAFFSSKSVFGELCERTEGELMESVILGSLNRISISLKALERETAGHLSKDDLAMVHRVLWKD